MQNGDWGLGIGDWGLINLNNYIFKLENFIRF